jgi:hypothetical protein
MGNTNEGLKPFWDSGIAFFDNVQSRPRLGYSYYEALELPKERRFNWISGTLIWTLAWSRLENGETNLERLIYQEKECANQQWKPVLGMNSAAETLK